MTHLYLVHDEDAEREQALANECGISVELLRAVLAVRAER